MGWVKVHVPDDFDPSVHKLSYTVDGWDLRHVDVWEPVYKNVLDLGHIGLVDFMGDDQAVVDAARVSYGKGTKRLTEDKGLIRYLFRHDHWTPVEMVEFKFHVKAPIFVFRQWHRHRTASINEYSARYSIMSDDMYVPHPEDLMPQSASNKQGREGKLSEKNAKACLMQLHSIYDQCAQAYKYLLGTTDVPDDSLNHRFQLIREFAIDKIKTLQETDPNWNPEIVTEQMVKEKEAEIFEHSGLWATDEEFWGDDGSGLSRELARMVMPLSTYSEMYWKSDLRNIFNFISLRSDSHAQKEIRDYSDAMMEMIEPIAPICVSAFLDYQMKGEVFSRMEMQVLRDLYLSSWTPEVQAGVEEKLKAMGCSKREVNEFLHRMEG